LIIIIGWDGFYLLHPLPLLPREGEYGWKHPFPGGGELLVGTTPLLKNKEG